jgi:hypothetical protein
VCAAAPRAQHQRAWAYLQGLQITQLVVRKVQHGQAGQQLQAAHVRQAVARKRQTRQQVALDGRREGRCRAVLAARRIILQHTITL